MASEKNLRIMHVGCGMKPWIAGGYAEYLDNIMEIQKKDGCKVFYFCSGRYFPLLHSAKLIRWKRKNIDIFEVITSGKKLSAQDGKAMKKYFAECVRKTRPDIIHIHLLIGFPNDLPAEMLLMKNRPKIIMTAHDYSVLCPKIKLLDYQNKICRDYDGGKKCRLCGQDSMKKNLIATFLPNKIKKFLLEMKSK